MAIKMTTCEVCGKEFAQKNDRQIYCGMACKTKAANARRKKEVVEAEYTCALCGKKFWTKPRGRHVYCSDKCRDIGMRQVRRKWEQVHRLKTKTNTAKDVAEKE